MSREVKEKAVVMVKLTINGQEYTVPKGTTVLEASLQNGIHIPTFCWHPKLKSVGACRMCYVEIEKMRNLMVSCATEVMDGMVVQTESEKVLQGRKAVIAFILANHPLDCPTCDKGGECDLQNLTFEHGVDDSQFAFQKYRFVDEDTTTTFDDKQIGPEIVLNRNRCILCYKCVRANKEVFGEYDLGAYERGNITQINAAPGQEVDNPFSGNLVEICPVGALTSSDWRYKIRVWLTQTVKGLDNVTSSGANILYYKEEHQNQIYRVTSRCNDDIDDGWIPDVVRYGYQIVNSPERMKNPLIKKEGKQVEATWDEALDYIHKRLSEIKDKMGSVCIGGFVSSTLDNKSLHSFNKFYRKVLNSNNVDFRTDYRMLPKDENSVFSAFTSQPIKLADIDDSDTIFVFGSDLLREHPNEYLRIRKAYRINSAKIYSINPYAVKTADIALLEDVYKAGFDEHVLNGIVLAGIEEGIVDSSKGAGLKDKISPNNLNEISKITGINENSFKIFARALANSKKVTFLMGEIITRSRDREAIAKAAANLNILFGISSKGQIAVMPRNANSVGAQKLGLLPCPEKNVKDKLAQTWDGLPDCVAQNTDSMLAQMKKEEISGMILMGLNPMMLYPDKEFIKEGLEKLDFLVVSDLFETETTELADVVLPMSSWAEYNGDYVNIEGKVQKSYKAVRNIEKSKPAYEIMQLLSEKFGASLFETETTANKEIQELLELNNSSLLPSELQEVSTGEDSTDEGFDIPLFICDDPHHFGHWSEKSPSLVRFCGEAYVEMSPELAEKFDLKEKDSVRVESPLGKIIAPVKISEHIENEVVLIPRNFAAVPVTSLMMRKKRIDRIKLSRVDD